MALVLAFCHLGVLILFLPICFNLTLLTLGCSVAAIVWSTPSFVSVYVADIELFLPVTLFLASSIYVQHRYIRSNQRVHLLATQQRRASEQETQRANMLHYLDMVTTEQFSEADILAKISTDQVDRKSVV